MKHETKHKLGHGGPCFRCCRSVSAFNHFLDVSNDLPLPWRGVPFELSRDHLLPLFSSIQSNQGSPQRQQQKGLHQLTNYQIIKLQFPNAVCKPFKIPRPAHHFPLQAPPHFLKHSKDNIGDKVTSGSSFVYTLYFPFNFLQAASSYKWHSLTSGRAWKTWHSRVALGRCSKWSTGRRRRSICRRHSWSLGRSQRVRCGLLIWKL